MEKKIINEKNGSVKSLVWFMVVLMTVETTLPSFLFANSLTPGQGKNFFQIESKHNDFPISITKKENAEIEISPKLPGGPDQPEVQSFTPIGTSDMVNPFTGNFSYNIPLLDVDGYPINIAYDAGITMDQEATWVGLGWNLNPGVVNRMMRGIPDDFNGSESIKKEFNMNKDWTVGTSAGVDVELFGFDPNVSGASGSLQATLGINYGNYTGFGADLSISAGISLAKKEKPALNFGLGLSGSSKGGATLSPSFGISKKSEDNNIQNSISIASPMNSRSGVSYSFSMSRTKSKSQKEIERTGDPNQILNGSVGAGGRNVSSSFSPSPNTYTPSIGMPMNSKGVTFSFKVGPNTVGLDVHGVFTGYFSAKWLKDNIQEVPAYGYLNLDKGQKHLNAMLDFNRENEGPFTKNTPALPIPTMTNDYYNVSGQGVSGSYRSYRPEFGYVFDAMQTSSTESGSVGGEVGLGLTAKGGLDVSGSYTNTQSGIWRLGNGSKLAYTTPMSQIPFREANEVSVNEDLAVYNELGGDKAVSFYNNSVITLQNRLHNENGSFDNTNPNLKRTNKEKRNQVFYGINHSIHQSGGGIQAIHPSAYNTNVGHHYSQFTTLNNEGVRYVYGIAAYNKTQMDVTFAVGKGNTSSITPLLPDCSNDSGKKGLIQYGSNAENIGTNHGVDGYYEKITTPAYAHSYLLTSVLNPDYIDIDGIQGPSKGDLGGYILFDYNPYSTNFGWRNPIQVGAASFDEGLNADQSDDKAHYQYGQKELWYLKTIKTKNHIAVFYTSDRADAQGVANEDGGPSNLYMQKLDKIELYSIPEYEANINNLSNAVPIKVVHFEYSYALCNNYYGSGPNTGKLTLESVYFTYGKSQKGRYSPYTFVYDYNPDYNMKNMDRWGNYVQPVSCSNDIASGPLRPSDYPYVGFDITQSNQNSKAWNMSAINLPSGGRMEVDYEADQYAYVQHKRANQMFKIIGVKYHGNSQTSGSINLGEPISSTSNVNNAELYIEIDPTDLDALHYKDGIKDVYFRALMKFASDKYDFVPGYAEIESFEISTTAIPGQTVGVLKLKPTTLKDNGNDWYNPIAVAAIQFGRLHLSRLIPPSGQDLSDGTNLKDLGMALVGAFKSFGELFKGPNKPLWDQKVGTDLVIGKSWVRLNNPTKRKLGGGHRVSEIRIYDNWDEMTQGPSTNGFHYGQKYFYDDGNISSGVASYEPASGADENVWRQPIANDTKLRLAPDIRNYQVTPYGEQYFPSPSVGYSKVTVKNIEWSNVNRTGTGKIVHEFYTAKEYPTLVDRTSPQVQRFSLPIFAYFATLSIDFLSASQGFVIEKNDMHGKPKAQWIYNESNDLISSVRYHYRHENIVKDGVSVFKLKNEVTAIQKNGQAVQKTVGLVFDAVADFRESTSETKSGSINGNLDFTLPFVFVPIITGSGSYENTQFRSASLVKCIERFAIMDSTVATDLGSTVATRDLAYDAETGTVLLTKTKTDFNDDVYNFSFPAHWYMEGMGQAYKNIDYETTQSVVFTNGYTNQLTATNGFFPGDEIFYISGGIGQKGWVSEVSSTAIRIINGAGDGINLTTTFIKILRSGRRNIQNTPVSTLALKSNPLNGLQANVFENVIQASAIEYSGDWNTFCDCFVSGSGASNTTNPYKLGIKGVYRPKASYTHLSGRSQAFENNNSNIREDGVMTSYTPFYKMVNGNWNIVKENWTYVSSVTQFSPFGQTLETIDALNRYSASLYGYNQALPIAVATNTKYSQLGFDGFEDYDYVNCSDKHFKLKGLNNPISTTQSHTGKRSVKVTQSTPMNVTIGIVDQCEDNLCNLISDFQTHQPNVPGLLGSFIVSGGQAPYEFEYNITQGSPTVTINTNGTGLNVLNNNLSCVIDVKAKDAKGCVLNYQIQF